MHLVVIKLIDMLQCFYAADKLEGNESQSEILASQCISYLLL